MDEGCLKLFKFVVGLIVPLVVAFSFYTRYF